VAIWGMADPGEQVTVSLAGQTGSATADPNGQWKVQFGPLKQGGPLEMTVAGKNFVTIHTLWRRGVGMLGPIQHGDAVSHNAEGWSSGVLNSEDEVAHANYPMMRLFIVKRRWRENRKPMCRGSGWWQAPRRWAVSPPWATSSAAICTAPWISP